MPEHGDALARGAASAMFQGPAREMPGTDVWSKQIEVAEPVFLPENAPRNGVMPIVEEKAQVGYEGDPTGDCVLVQRVEREHSSNLILPDSLKAKSDLGYVKAVGEVVKFYKPGNLVLFDKFASHGADISLIDEDGIERPMLLLREYDILMRLKRVTVSAPDQTERGEEQA